MCVGWKEAPRTKQRSLTLWNKLWIFGGFFFHCFTTWVSLSLPPVWSPPSKPLHVLRNTQPRPLEHYCGRLAVRAEESSCAHWLQKWLQHHKLWETADTYNVCDPRCMPVYCDETGLHISNRRGYKSMGNRLFCPKWHQSTKCKTSFIDLCV